MNRRRKFERAVVIFFLLTIVALTKAGCEYSMIEVPRVIKDSSGVTKGVSITPSSASIGPGQTLQLSASVSGSTDSGVTW